MRSQRSNKNKGSCDLTTKKDQKKTINKKVKNLKTKTQEETQNIEKGSQIQTDHEKQNIEPANIFDMQLEEEAHNSEKESQIQPDHDKQNIQPADIFEIQNEANPMHYSHSNLVLINKNIKFEQKYKYLGNPQGTGSFGTVFKCMHRETNMVRAVKIIQVENSENGGPELRKIRNEMDILRTLDHPNIVKTYEYFKENNKFFIVTDYCEGGELYDKILEKKCFDEINASNIVKQILSAINYCHKKSLVHCDLKPENIIFTDKSDANDNIRIIDFGNSIFFNPFEKLQVKFGSVYYVAPEVLNCSYDERCDIWSIGVILYIQLTGCPPFNGRNDKIIMEKIKICDYNLEGPKWENISDEAKDLVKKMITLDPELRIKTQDALSHPFFTNNSKNKVNVNEKHVAVQNRILKSLKNFRSESKLQEAIYFFLMTHLSNDQEKDRLLNVFLELDEDCDGKITTEDLKNCYEKVLGQSYDNVSDIASKIMENVDISGEGTINYSEFIAACIDKKKLFSEERLQTAFNLFKSNKDVDYITIEDLRKVFDKGCFQNLDDGLWTDLITEFNEKIENNENQGFKRQSSIDFVKKYSNNINDENNVTEIENKITFENFKKMMSMFASNDQFTQTQQLTQNNIFSQISV